MNANPIRNENSVQMSLEQLRRLHTARIESEAEVARKRQAELDAQRIDAETRRMAQMREAEAERLAAEYERERLRLAAEHELELAKEKARADADARVKEKRLEVELKKAESELLATQAALPKKRGWLAVAGALLCLAVPAGFYWQHQESQARMEAVRSTLEQAREDSHSVHDTVRGLEHALSAAEKNAQAASERALALEQRLSGIETGARPRPRPNTNATPTSHPKPKPQPKPTPVAVPDACLNNPLCE